MTSSISLQSVLLFEKAPPPTLPPQPENPPPGVFSVVQLNKLHSQLSSLAPKGLMLAQSFVETLHGFTENTVRITTLREIFKVKFMCISLRTVW